MRFFNLLIIPVFMSFWDCDRPREPAQPVSQKASVLQSELLPTVEWHLKKLLRNN